MLRMLIFIVEMVMMVVLLVSCGIFILMGSVVDGMVLVGVFSVILSLWFLWLSGRCMRFRVCVGVM